MKPCLSRLICPVCGGRLSPVERRLQCARAHSFDLAREGYVNLGRGGRPAKFPGDSPEMLRARRRFLQQGYFQPLVEAINQQVYQHLVQLAGPTSPPLTLLDLGCGEGYYLGQLKAYLTGRLGDQPLCYFGMDLAKAGLKMAARQHQGIQFFAGNVTTKVLLEDQSVHCLLNIFAPRNGAEFARVSHRQGLLVVVIPGPAHLADVPAEWRPLTIEAGKSRRVIEKLGPAFALRQELELAYDLSLPGPALADLIQMTPNYRHLAPAQRAALAESTGLKSRANFILLTFGRT